MSTIQAFFSIGITSPSSYQCIRRKIRLVYFVFHGRHISMECMWLCAYCHWGSPNPLVNNVTGWRYITKVKVYRRLHKYLFRNFFLCQQYKLFFPLAFIFFYFISNNNWFVFERDILKQRFSNIDSIEQFLHKNILKKSEFIRSSFRALTRWRRGIVQSNLCWKIFVLKYLVQIQIIQNQFKISEGGKWNSHQMSCVYSSRMVKNYRICPQYIV
jgi:hypothetical protein